MQTIKNVCLTRELSDHAGRWISGMRPKSTIHRFGRPKSHHFRQPLSSVDKTKMNDCMAMQFSGVVRSSIEIPPPPPLSNTD